MASKTKKTRNVRKKKLNTRGKANKRKRRTKGTTPKFAIHV